MRGRIRTYFLKKTWNFQGFRLLEFFPQSFSSIPLEIPCPQPAPVWIFSGIAQCRVSLRNFSTSIKKKCPKINTKYKEQQNMGKRCSQICTFEKFLAYKKTKLVYMLQAGSIQHLSSPDVNLQQAVRNTAPITELFPYRTYYTSLKSLLK